MVTYTCETCDKTFTQKGHYDSHKARKRPCKKDPTIEKRIEQQVLLATTNVVVHPVPTVKPFLKWVGGKTQIIDEVLSQFPRALQNYYEPFLGGGSVLIALLTEPSITVKGTIYASDLNSNLIGLYKNIQANPEELIKAVTALATEYSQARDTTINRAPTTLEEALTSPESYYFWTRAKFNAMTTQQRTTVQGSAFLLFLNKTCFRGLYREGPRGFNVPFGNYKNPTILEEENIRALSTLFRPVVFSCSSWSEVLPKPTTGDFIYLDPPYAPEQGTSFVSYTADGFDLEAHNALFKATKELKERGVGFLMSNADVPLVREAFLGYETKSILCRRAIHSKTPDAKTREVLIRN
jgi:DNA adenine methylase